MIVVAEASDCRPTARCTHTVRSYTHDVSICIYTYIHVRYGVHAVYRIVRRSNDCRAGSYISPSSRRQDTCARSTFVVYLSHRGNHVPCCARGAYTCIIVRFISPLSVQYDLKIKIKKAYCPTLEGRGVSHVKIYSCTRLKGRKLTDHRRRNVIVRFSVAGSVLSLPLPGFFPIRFSSRTCARVCARVRIVSAQPRLVVLTII